MELRNLVRVGYRSKWGGDAEVRMLRAFGEDQRRKIEENRAKRRKTFPDAPSSEDTLDFLYLGDLTRLINSGEVWDQYKPVFGDKSVLSGHLADISPVRNDRAHFRQVAEKELQRCAIACDDLLVLIAKKGAKT